MVRQTHTLETYLASKQQVIDKALDAYLPAADAYPAALHAAIRHSVFASGKRLRPVLTLAVGEALEGSEELLLPAACAVEMVHTASLIHDDLPSMDNADLRRGRPACHRAFGEATAILAGDWLLIQPFLILVEETQRLVAVERGARAAAELAKAIGSGGMIAGQVADLEAEGKVVSSEAVEFIHSHKTAALISAAARMGAILAGASEDALAKVTDYGQALGRAFQVVDDILDATSEAGVLGKPAGADAARGKATLVALLGVAGARGAADRLCRRAEEAAGWLETGPGFHPLQALAEYVLARSR